MSNNPIVLYNNILEDAASVDTAGEPLTNADTADRWVPDDTDTVEFNSIPTSLIDHIGLAAHTLGTSGSSILVEGFDGSSWFTITTLSSSSDQAIFTEVSATSVQGIRTTAQGGGIEVGVLYVGTILTFERQLYQGHTPIEFADQNTRTVPRAQGGHYVGNNVRRRSKQTSYSIDNLTPEFVRSTLEEFRQAFDRGRRFFMSWRPDTFSGDAVFARGDGLMELTNSGPRDLMSADFDIMAYILESRDCEGQIYAGDDPVFAGSSCVVARV